jgi:hypothetical protein
MEMVATEPRRAARPGMVASKREVRSDETHRPTSSVVGPQAVSENRRLVALADAANHGVLTSPTLRVV